MVFRVSFFWVHFAFFAKWTKSIPPYYDVHFFLEINQFPPYIDLVLRILRLNGRDIRKSCRGRWNIRKATCERWVVYYPRRVWTIKRTPLRLYPKHIFSETLFSWFITTTTIATDPTNLFNNLVHLLRRYFVTSTWKMFCKFRCTESFATWASEMSGTRLTSSVIGFELITSLPLCPLDWFLSLLQWKQNW